MANSSANMPQVSGPFYFLSKYVLLSYIESLLFSAFNIFLILLWKMTQINKQYHSLKLSRPKDYTTQCTFI